MKEIRGNIFDVKDADAICVTTNGVVKHNGELVMGAGIAKVFRDKFPGLAVTLGRFVKQYGNVVCFVSDYDNKLDTGDYNVISFPTKHDWKDKSIIQLIQVSARGLVETADLYDLEKVILTRPGCGLGGLNWETQVKPAIKDILDDRFYIITP
jgi:hypothetical protein